MTPKASAINIIWLGLVLIATVTAAYTGKMEAVTKASFDSAKDAVTLAIGLIGPMALWLGIMKVAEAGGLMRLIARGVRPVMTRLFPDVPAEHPAMSAMIMNIAANTLGLGNAATPMGIKAMQELDKISAEKGTATNAMCLFLAINTSCITILPLGVITVRAAAGAESPAAILIPSILATACSTLVAITAAKLLAGRETGPPVYSAEETEADTSAEEEADESIPELVQPSPWGRLFIFALIAAFGGGIIYNILTNPDKLTLSTDLIGTISNWLIPIIISALVIFGYLRGVKIYETITEGAKEGFNTAIRIIPFMVAIFVGIGMFRASGALEIMIDLLTPLTGLINMPAESLTVALMRPLSGSGSFGIMSEIVGREPDSFLSFLVSTMQGSTETTFYVLAVYFGAISIRRTRHALPAALCADAAGVLAAVFITNLWL